MAINRSTLAVVLLILFSGVTTAADSQLFHAAVVEYYYNLEDNSNFTEIFYNNLDEFVNIISEFNTTKQRNSEVQDGIIVFPECGLTKEHISDPNLFVEVPDPDYHNTNFSGNTVLTKISNASILTNTWVVINLMEKSKDGKYNTDVVFANNGTIAARYRKYNLFGEPLNKTQTPEVISFTTNFGVTFGIFTCFDILFSTPALELVRKNNIKHFIFPTDWYSETPFLTAVQYQMSWSYANDVTLLAAGLGFSKVGSTGSGIYLGKHGPLKYYQTTHSDETKMIYSILSSTDQSYNKSSQIITIPKKNPSVNTSNHPSDLLLKKEPLFIYSSVLINPLGCDIPDDFDSNKNIRVDCSKNISESVCNGNLCCTFNLSVMFQLCVTGTKDCDVQPRLQQDDFSLDVHRLVVLDGVRGFQVATGGLQTCAVVSCTNADLESCSEKYNQTAPYINIEGTEFRVIRRFILDIKIRGIFSLQEGGKENFITPNTLLGHSSKNKTDQYGLIESDVTFTVDNQTGDTLYHFKPTNYRDNPVGTAGIWSRVYSRDGQPVSSSISLKISFLLLIASLFICQH